MTVPLDLALLTQILAGDPDDLRRAEAARRIGTLGIRAHVAVPSLIAALESVHRTVRISACQALEDLVKRGLKVKILLALHATLGAGGGAPQAAAFLERLENEKK